MGPTSSEDYDSLLFGFHKEHPCAIPWEASLQFYVKQQRFIRICIMISRWNAWLVLKTTDLGGWGGQKEKLEGVVGLRGSTSQGTGETARSWSSSGSICEVTWLSWTTPHFLSSPNSLGFGSLPYLTSLFSCIRWVPHHAYDQDLYGLKCLKMIILSHWWSLKDC